MKEKCLNFIAVALKHKKILLGLLAFIIAILIIFYVVLGGKPKKYKDKIEAFADSQYSEVGMNNLIKDGTIDLKAAVAWQNANHDPGKFKKEYKKIKNNSDTTLLEKAILEYARESEGYEADKVYNIEKPKKDKKYGKIYTVFANLGNEECYFVFYKNKIIDVMIDNGETSYFEYMLELYD